MLKQPSTPIKIAAFFFLVGGSLTTFTSFLTFTVSTSTGSADAESLKGLIGEIVNLVFIGFGIANVLVGWFLMKLKNWAYVLGLVLTSLSLAMYLFALVAAGTTAYYSLVLSLVLLGLLISGKKDFKKSKQ